jgi:tetratricopeptide (TPR) repeat protein
MNAQISVPNHRTTLCIAEQTKNIKRVPWQRTQMQFADYATKASSLIAAAPRSAGYPRSVAATFDLAIAEAVAQCQAAEALMAYLAHCAPERIPMTLVEGAIEDEPERLQALAALSEVSLVRPDPFEDGTPAVTVHRLVQAAARAQSKTNGLAKDAIGRLIARLVAIYPGAASDVCSQLTPHLLARREADPGNALEVAGWPLVLEKAGYHFHGLGAYSEAVPFLRDALAIYERRLGPEHRDTARTLNNLALTLAYQGDYAGARPLHERRLALVGPEHPDTAASLNNLALLFQRQDDWAASAALETGGSSKSTGRSFRGGAIRSRHSRSAVRSPSFASSIALRVMVSASPSSSASTASVVLFRVPLSFPAGLPLFPGSKGISGVASVLHFQLSARISVLRRAKQSPQNYPWLAQLMARRPFKVVAIALANKMARVAWALLARGGSYRAPRLAAA